MSGLTFHYHWKWSLQSSIEALWPYISDTDRFRGATGYPAATYRIEPQPDGTPRRIGRIRMYGFPMEWTEEPFEWIRHRELIDIQRYSVGPMKYLRVHIILEPRSDGGTTILYDVTAQVGNVLGYPGIPLQIGLLSMFRFRRAFQQMDDYARNNAKLPFKARTTSLSATGRLRLRDMISRLTESGYDPTLVNRLTEYIRTAPDHELTRMRPFAFADQWHTDRYATLELFLQATKFGLLDLSWDMLCPECRGAKHTAHELHDVTHDAYCPSCNINYEVDFARSVEATFQVNPAIKAIVREEFCMGSPQNTPHILMQQNLAPGESRTVTMLLEPDQYRWRVPKLAKRDAPARAVNTINDVTAKRSLLDVNTKTKSTSSTLTLTADGPSVEQAEIGAGVAILTIVNNTNTSQIVLLERTEWSDQATTAAEITSLQSFRDLFTGEVLRPGESIGVERMALLFTDLKGSTNMYTMVGDAPAFRRVMDHFDLLKQEVAKNHGALVKTIGDAIMAVFTDPAYAVNAALDILDQMEQYNAQNPDFPLILKMGVHQGACIAVTLNERLDYFGSVVNIAARLEGQSKGHDVTVSDAVITDPAVAELLKKRLVSCEDFTTTLKGFSDAFSLHRLSSAKSSVTQSLPAVVGSTV